MENDSSNERIEAPAPEEHMDRRGFLGLVKNWSAAVALGVVAGAALFGTQQAQAAAGWANSRGGGGGAAWANRGGGGGAAGWANRGGGGAVWANGGGGGGWANRGGGGAAWVNSRGGGGAAWANRR
jgi:hypothetical protein